MYNCEVMVVSASTLFHFTNSLETLKAILSSRAFWPRYCVEYAWSKKIAIPQCCFCDIPLSSICGHMKFYGKFGIGMRKEWGETSDVSPVLYVVKGSGMCKGGRMLLKEPNEAQFRFFVMLKAYCGVNYRKEKGKLRQYKAYKYYDEREWRYVPKLKDFKKLVVKVGREGLHNKQSLNAETKNKEYMLSFDETAVKYLIVNSDDDRKEMLDFLSNAKMWSEESRERLKAKIITTELINSDI